jgi:hypothetical protein
VFRYLIVDLEVREKTLPDRRAEGKKCLRKQGYEEEPVLKGNESGEEWENRQ